MKTALKVTAMCFAFFVGFDFLIAKPLLGLGYPTHYAQENLQRAPAPYIGFKGKPNVLGHDRWGYRRVPESDRGAIKVAFFGGSTGYEGNPPVPDLVQSELSDRLGKPVAVANFSVVSSNHRQHLHNIIESRSIFEPDLIIFYGGYNEMPSAVTYDPRPGYPYNFFFREETSPLVQLLLRYSAFFGMADQIAQRRFNASMTPIARLRAEYKPLSLEWKRNIIDKYFETLEHAKTVAEASPSKRCRNTRFVAFYQPYQVISELMDVHTDVRRRLTDLRYGIDISDAFDGLGKEIYTDIVHVGQAGNERIAKVIAGIIIRRGILAGCN